MVENYFLKKQNKDTRLSDAKSVSIITRTKNRPVLLARALSSVLSQTHDNWEHIIVNDGGDEHELKTLLEQYRPAYGSKLKVISHPESLGMEAASNAGLEASSGTFVIIHDDDDAWHPFFLEKTIRYLTNPENSSCVAVASNCYVVKEYIDGDRVIEIEKHNWGFWRPQINCGMMYHTNSIPPICLLIRKSAMEKIGPFNSDLPVLGDWDYNIRLLSEGNIGTIPDKLAYYCHRVSDNAEENVYGNTVSEGNVRHEKYRAEYLNDLWRELVLHQPGYIALVSTLMEAQTAKINEVHKHLDFLYDKVNHESAELHQHLDYVLDNLKENRRSVAFLSIRNFIRKLPNILWSLMNRFVKLMKI